MGGRIGGDGGGFPLFNGSRVKGEIRWGYKSFFASRKHKRFPTPLFILSFSL